MPLFPVFMGTFVNSPIFNIIHWLTDVTMIVRLDLPPGGKFAEPWAEDQNRLFHSTQNSPELFQLRGTLFNEPDQIFTGAPGSIFALIEKIISLFTNRLNQI